MCNFNLFNYNQIKSYLSSSLNEKIFLRLFATTDSTNDQAKDYLKKLNKNSDMMYNNLGVFAADIQKKGRGRRGHSWFSGDTDGIAVSFLFELRDDLAQIQLITAAAALAINESFEKFNLKTDIKWPNDILAADKKIAGILAELVIAENEKTFIIIGCGINLNNSVFNNTINNLATSYYLEKKEKLDKNLFLSELIKKINYYLNYYFEGGKNHIIETWKKNLNLIGKKIDFTYKNDSYTGQIKKILKNGDLLIQLNDGQEKQLDSLNTSLDYKSLAKYNPID